MPRGKGTKRGSVGRGVIANNNRECSQHLQDTSQINTLQPLTPSSQGVNSDQHVSTHENALQQAAHASTNIAAEKTLVSQFVTAEQTTHGSGHQQSSRNVAAEKETLPSQVVTAEQTAHASINVSSQQTTPAFHATTNRRARRIILRGIRPLTTNGEKFCPHDAVRDVTAAFKKSFAGPWYSWKKVPPHVQDQWFNDFQKSYSFCDEEKALVQATFNLVGSDRLSDILGKAKRKFLKCDQAPKWIGRIHWDEMMEYWNSEDFKKISEINSKNRMSCNNGEGPSLHTGGSVSFAEYKRRHKELTGQVLSDIQLYLKTHRTENKEWICGKSQRVWDTFVISVKQNRDATTTIPSDEDGSEVGDKEINIPTNEEEEAPEANEDDFLKMLETIPEEQLLNTWIDAAGVTKKRKIYGFALETSVTDSLHVGSTSSSAHPAPPSVPLQQILEQPEFGELVNRLLGDQIASMQEKIEANMRTTIRAEVEAVVSAVMNRMLGLHPQPRPTGSGSPSDLP